MYDRLITAERFNVHDKEELREATERDRGRIVQAAPVRRLQQKTQVFPLDVKSSARSRLTHSLEVVECGRQIARRILTVLPDQSTSEGAFINLVEMSCLLHDIGNPPFGHFGEQVINQWLAEQLDRLYTQALSQTPTSQWSMLRQDLLLFDGNAQSLRVVHSLQELNLTLSQLAALCKYPLLSSSLDKGEAPYGWSHKRGIFFSEQTLYHHWCHRLGVASGCRHPLVYIMEAADDISYSIADLDDALERRVITFAELLQGLQGADGGDYLAALLHASQEQGRDFFSYFRQHLTDDLVAVAAKTYIDEHSAILQGRYDKALFHDQAPAARVLDILKRFAREQIFMRPEVERLELEGYAALRGVLSIYSQLLAMPAAQFERLLAGDRQGDLFFVSRLYHRLSRRHIKAYRMALLADNGDFTCKVEKEWYYRVRLLLDYVSGMTDTYVLEEYRLFAEF